MCETSKSTTSVFCADVELFRCVGRIPVVCLQRGSRHTFSSFPGVHKMLLNLIGASVCADTHTLADVQHTSVRVCGLGSEVSTTSALVCATRWISARAQGLAERMLQTSLLWLCSGEVWGRDGTS